jgi:hypothetical protein
MIVNLLLSQPAGTPILVTWPSAAVNTRAKLPGGMAASGWWLSLSDPLTNSRWCLSL